jgi:hypothetical protein
VKIPCRCETNNINYGMLLEDKIEFIAPENSDDEEHGHYFKVS